MPLTPEVLVPRIGEVLVRENLLTSEQLNLALERQKIERISGNSIQIGQLLVEMGFISSEILDQAVTTQILKLHSALNESNKNLEQRVQERTTELEIAYKRLSELTHLKSNFISNISHELRTPLTHIKGYIDLFLSDESDELNPMVIQGLQVMQRATERLRKLIDDLIQFSAAEIGSMQIELSRVNLVPIVEKAYKRCMVQAEQKEIDLVLDCSPKNIDIVVDADRIEWVIGQLIDNALKYTPRKGKVVVSINLKNDVVLVMVEDTGIGIDQSNIQEIFEPFHQLDGSSRRNQGGTGIGLTLARRIIEAHGSKILVTSLTGKGSKFEFQLPVSKKSH